MSAGKMDRRVRFERATTQDDGFSSDGEVTWSPIATVWAESTPVSDGEKWRAGQTGSTVTHRFLIRYSTTLAGLTPADRAVFEGKQFDISGVKEVGRRARLEITATARAE